MSSRLGLLTYDVTEVGGGGAERTPLLLSAAGVFQLTVHFGATNIRIDTCI